MAMFEKLSRAAVWAVTLPIRFYRRFVSPITPPMCKYYPSCSAYSLEAYRRHGVFKGTLLTVWRLLRCNPWSNGGVDHVPDKFTRIYFVPKKAADVYKNTAVEHDEHDE